MSEPTVFHITHYKAGSTWVGRILARALGRERLVMPKPARTQFLDEPIVEGRVYPRLYATREEFDAVLKPPDSKRFVVIRDLRDTLISGYFSVKQSHVGVEKGGASERMAPLRAELQALDQQAGLALAARKILPGYAAIQESWVYSGEPLLRYEDLLQRDLELLERALNATCGLDIPPADLRAAVEECRFESMSGGRARGEEDVNAHQRKGVAGDWRNHMSEPLKDEIKQRYGNLLIATGYETGFDW